jgi:predicted aldo/keto reductase-like oxidoreductase
MKGKSMDRRDFLRKCLTATAGIGALSAAPLRAVGKTKALGFAYDAKGLPTRVLGKTSVPVPIIGFGGGSRFLRVQDLDKSLELLTYALDHGLYYWDTAQNYTSDKIFSEERLGLILKSRRREVFLGTKVEERTYDGAMKQLEASLKRLQTNHLDIYQVHAVESLEDVDKIGAKGGVLEALYKLREQKVARYIGFSGHADAEAMTAMVNRHDFDTMLIALNHMEDRKGDFEKGAIPAAAKKKMGVMVIKVIRPRETVEGIVPEELIRYAFSLELVHSAVIGHDSLDVLRKNIELAKSFEKMTAAEMADLESRLQPFFQGRNLPWLRPEYTDGVPA